MHFSVKIKEKIKCNFKKHQVKLIFKLLFKTNTFFYFVFLSPSDKFLNTAL